MASESDRDEGSLRGGGGEDEAAAGELVAEDVAAASDELDPAPGSLSDLGRAAFARRRPGPLALIVSDESREVGGQVARSVVFRHEATSVRVEVVTCGGVAKLRLLHPASGPVAVATGTSQELPLASAADGSLELDLAPGSPVSLVFGSFHTDWIAL